MTALIGPSGCGKSTLLRVFNRIYALYPKQEATGEVLLDGENILDPKYPMNRLRSKVGMVFQKPVPFPMTIYENVAYGIRHHERLNKADMDARVEHALRQAALWDEVKDKLKDSGLSLSGGQQQRLCIARAVALRPDVLLLDEPTSALDPISTSRIEQLVEELKQDFTIMIVTHNMQQAARVSDYTAFMYLGDMIEHGATEQIFSNPGQAADRGLHHGTFRLMNGTTTSSRATTRNSAALLDELIRMGQMSVAQLEAALDVVERRDDKAAERVIGNDEAIDELEQQVNHDVIRLIRRGPLATDLRVILAALRVASDIERIGDYAANIAKRSMALNLSPPLPHTRGLDALGRLAARQVRDVLDAYVQRDADAALRVRANDAELDTLYTGLFRELLTYMMEDARAITPCTHLLFMAKNLERIGDHATNIAENVWFLIHGEEFMPPRDKRDDSSTTVV